MTAQAALNSLLDRKKRNLAYFKQAQPDVYEYIKSHQFKKLNLNISPDGKNLTVLKEGKPVYEQDMLQFIEQEVQGFLTQFSPDSTFLSANKMSPASYSYPRFSHQYMKDLLNALPNEQYMGIHTPDTLPLVIFTGVGTGLHIELTLAQRPAKHIVIFDTDPDNFLLSLYLSEWQQVIETAIKNHQSKISFCLLDIENEEGLTEAQLQKATYATLWEQIHPKFPIFPCTTFFYNHLKSSHYKKVIQDIQVEIGNLMGAWGYYDDEINQFNNALHNINHGMKILSKHKLNQEKTVFIVGSGPSLTNSIPLIKEVREKIVLVSSGTSLTKILSEGLIPDFHAEIESDYITHTAVASNDRKKLKEITLLCPTQLNPLTPPLFKDCYYYLKEEAAHVAAFNMSEHLVKSCTPSCVNSALASIIQMGYKNIFFTGTDFGYKDISRHHVEGTVYDNDQKLSAIMDKNISTSKIFETRFDGTNIYSTDFYYLCKSKIELKISMTLRAQSDCQFYNLSDGLTILSTPFISPENAKKVILESKHHSDSILIPTTKRLNARALTPLKETSHKELTAVCEQLTNIVRPMHNTTESIRDTCYEISQFITIHSNRDCGNFANFIRGTIWGSIYALYVEYLSTKDKNIKEAVYTIWKERFLTMLTDTPKHFETFLDKDYSQKDPMVYRSIMESEDISS